MAEEKERKRSEPQSDDEGSAKPRKKKLPMTVILIVGITLVQGAGFYAVTKIFGGGPSIAHGEEGHENNLLKGEEATSQPTTAEVEVMKNFRVPNEQRGRLYIYDFDLFAKVTVQKKEELSKIIADRKGEISDRIARLVRAAEPTILHEAELKTLRLQIRQVLGEIARDPEIVSEVLLPRFVPIRSD